MKTRIISLVVLVAALTLSFTFISVRSSEVSKAEEPTKESYQEPVGGFISEDQL